MKSLSETALLSILSDGEFHSGQQLANLLDVSRTAIWKQLNKVKEKELDLYSVRGRGYRLASPLELLNEKLILQYAGKSARQVLPEIEVHYELPSTNQYLLDRLPGSNVHGRAVLVEYQSHGKGRGGNRWLSALCSGLCLSVGWHFQTQPASLGALSLATGVVIANTIRNAGCQSVSLKWPNDILGAGVKIGGILIESRGQIAGPVDVIIGIGLNIKLPENFSSRINQKAGDLKSISSLPISRNKLAGTIIKNTLSMLDNYASDGFESYIDEWRKLDYARGKNAMLKQEQKTITGQVVDIDEDGRILLSVSGKLMKYSSGDLTLRIMN